VSRALSKTISHALRHEPWLYELELDDEGWASVDQLIAALRERGGSWTHVDRAAIEAAIGSSDKERHEIVGDRIRALYGHSIPGKLARTPATPPDVLLHGTAPTVADEILKSGLKPMSRQYVHLSVDLEMALAVGRRKHPRAVILRVDATRANAEGIAFYRGNERVWLADFVPPAFIEGDDT
jgi:putative RNA 2'-phosphotransferase